MKGRTHFAFALLLGFFFSWFFDLSIPNSLFFSAILLFAALLPDIDDHHSLLGKRLKVISLPITLIFGHRGIFHSPLIPILATLILITVDRTIYAWGFMIGYLSHLILDSLTHSGIRWFYPFPYKMKGVIKSGGIIDFIFFLSCLGAIIMTAALIF
jgi:inner membrane protein